MSSTAQEPQNDRSDSWWVYLKKVSEDLLQCPYFRFHLPPWCLPALVHLLASPIATGNQDTAIEHWKLGVESCGSRTGLNSLNNRHNQREKIQCGVPKSQKGKVGRDHWWVYVNQPPWPSRAIPEHSALFIIVHFTAMGSISYLNHILIQILSKASLKISVSKAKASNTQTLWMKVL